MEINNDYKPVYLAICERLSVLSEITMEKNKKDNDLVAYRSSKELRDKIDRISDSIKVQGLSSLVKEDWMALLAGAQVIMGQLAEEAKKTAEVVERYKIELIPELSKIINEFEKSNN